MHTKLFIFKTKTLVENMICNKCFINRIKLSKFSHTKEKINFFNFKNNFKTNRNFKLQSEWDREYNEIKNKGINRLALNKELFCTIQAELDLFQKKFDLSMQKYLFESNYKLLDLNERGNIQLTKNVENLHIIIEAFKFKPNIDDELLNEAKKEYMEREFVKPMDNFHLVIGEHLPKEEVDEFIFDEDEKIKASNNIQKIHLLMMKIDDAYSATEKIGVTNNCLLYEISISKNTIFINSITVYFDDANIDSKNTFNNFVQKSDDNLCYLINLQTNKYHNKVKLNFDCLNETVQSYFVNLLDNFIISKEVDIKLFKYLGVFAEISQYIRGLKKAQHVLI